MEQIKLIARFGLTLLVFSVVVFGSAWYVQEQVDYRFLSEHYISLTIFLFLITLSAYAISSIGIAGNPELGVFGILGGITIKMIVSLSFFLFLLYRFPVENQTIMGLNFFCIYLFLTCFEVTVLLRNLRRKFK